MKNIYRYILRLLLGGILLFTIILVLDSNAFDEIPPKDNPESLRIGYANMYMQPFTEEEQVKYLEADCDLWLILEWTGMNVSKTFYEKYEIVSEQRRSNPHGYAVFAKKGVNISLNVRNKSNPDFACNFPYIEMEVNGMHLDFVHAPPPVPTCKFNTPEFIDFLLDEIQGPNKENAILIGDLNTMPFQSKIKNVKDLGYRDVFTSKGLFNGTYSGIHFFPNLIRIDYAFIKGDIKSSFSTRLKVRNSDHSGLILDVAP